MTITDETTKTRRRPLTYTTYKYGYDGEQMFSVLGENDPLLRSSNGVAHENLHFFRQMYPHLFPAETEYDLKSTRSSATIDGSEQQRSFRRRLFLFLTEPSSSWLSAAFFFCLIFTITVSSVITVMQTMPSFQYTPADCTFCDSHVSNAASVDDEIETHYGDDSTYTCECPPRSYEYLETIIHRTLKFFAVEWTLRVLSYEPAHPKSNFIGQASDWVTFLTSSTTLIDALAIWPNFIENMGSPRLISLRLLRLFRVFQLLRLGSYNEMFVSLTKVLYKSIQFLKLLVVILVFGAAIFGCLVFWLEQGEWKYWEPTRNFQYVRMGIDEETEEISPFRSIPTAFWWFIVTATTVGYGDIYPTSTGGRWIAALAMLIGVLVIAFPVSIFSDLWSEELRQVKGLESLFKHDSRENETGGDADSVTSSPQHENWKNNITQYHILPNYNTDAKNSISNREASSDTSTRVVMEREDLNEILSSLYSIQKEQRHVQQILKKYFEEKE